MIVNSLARKSIFTFGWIASAIVTISVLAFSKLSIIFPILLTAIGMFSIDYYTNPRRKYYLPVIWTIYYIFGYILCLSDMLINSDVVVVDLIIDKSMFEFSNENFLPIFCSILSGMLGIFVAVVFCERIYQKKANFVTENRGLGLLAKNGSVKMAILAWGILSAGIIIIMGVLGIGRTGLPHATVLPLKLTGILVYIKHMVIPFFGYIIFLRIVKTKNLRGMLFFLIVMIIVGAIGSIVFISRSFIIFLILGPILYIFFSEQQYHGKIKLFIVWVAISAGILLFIIPVIQVIRDVKYSGYDVSISQFVGSEGLLKFDEAISQVVSLFIGRIVGLHELVGIHNFMPNDLYGPLKVFIGDSDYTDMLLFEIHGFQQDPSGDTAFGYAFGLWGMMYLSGSNFIVLTGTFIFTTLIICFEELFSRLSSKPLALFIALQLGTWIWGGIDLFLLSRLIITAVVCITILQIPIARRYFFVDRHIQILGKVDA